MSFWVAGGASLPRTPPFAEHPFAQYSVWRVDEVGEGITGVAAGDPVFGFSPEGAGAAELALLSHYAPIPPSLGFAEAAGPSPSALDVAGSGVLPELIELAGGPEHVVTVADFAGARGHRVWFSSGDDAGRAVHARVEIGELIDAGRFSLPVAQTFPLAETAKAHRVSEDGHARGKLVLLVG